MSKRNGNLTPFCLKGKKEQRPFLATTCGETMWTLPYPEDKRDLDFYRYVAFFPTVEAGPCGDGDGHGKAHGKAKIPMMPCRMWVLLVRYSTVCGRHWNVYEDITDLEQNCRRS